jgi:hypothetical protein
VKKILSLSLLLILILSSCNLPVAETAPPPTEISPKDLIATMVAQTVTANPIVPATETQAVAPTLTDTAAVPSATATATPGVTTTATEASGPTLSPSPTSNGDYASSLGQPTWKDTFETSGGFFEKGTNSYEDDHTRIAIENGMMTLTSFGSPPNWRSWRLTYPSVKNFYLETTFVTHDCAGADQYGMVFRAPDFDSGFGYYLAFNCGGSYSLVRMDDTGFVTITPWSQSSDLLAGSGQTNRMGILTSGTTISIYINGSKVLDANDSHFQDAGHFGPFIAYSQTPNFSVDLKSIAYWIMP